MFLPADRHPPNEGHSERRPATDADFDMDLDPDDDTDEALDAEFPLGDGTADRDTVVMCPYCGEPNEIALDPGSGTHQDYIEDCAVCCQPWQVIVSYGPDGSADVSVLPADGR